MREIALCDPFTKVADPYHGLIPFARQPDLQPFTVPPIPYRIGNQILIGAQQFIRSSLNP
ncbi:hypothetical protein D3C81_1936700 [compost metagenome]